MHKLEERLKLMPPDEIFSMINLKKGDVFLDIGAGPGGFSIPAANLVGPGGKVIALDISQEILDYLSVRVNEAGIENIEIIRSEENDLMVPDQTGDISFLCMVFHETTTPVLFLQKVFRATKPGGKVVVIEWAKKPMEKGPPIEDRLELEEVKDYLRETGFTNVSGYYFRDYFFYVGGTREIR